MSIKRAFNRVERMHSLISKRRTGSPGEFAQKIGVSRSTLFVIISELKQLGAPIIFSREYQSYMYEYSVHLSLGFVFLEERRITV